MPDGCGQFTTHLLFAASSDMLRCWQSGIGWLEARVTGATALVMLLLLLLCWGSHTGLWVVQAKCG
jgi:hypothetical protein